MFLLIDNYDSFTYNLVQAFGFLGHKPIVMSNDDPELLALATDPKLCRVCISPGPGHPDRAGLCLEFLQRLSPAIPVLGVCLGHQVLGRFAGVEVNVGPVIMHGKTSKIAHDGQGLFAGLPNPMCVGRYHSLVVNAGDNHPEFTVTARAAEGEVMAMTYNDRPWAGIQFHPESILTPDGLRLLENFLFRFPNANGGKSPSRPETPGTAQTAGNSGAVVEAAPKNEPPVPLSRIFDAIGQREDLSEAMAKQIFSRLMDGDLSPAQAGAVLLGLRSKGETPVEMAMAAEAVLERAVHLSLPDNDFIDVVGTGGDGRSSFNCSTATALTLAGLGFPVVKHGNRSISSKCGSADVLERLGLPLDTPPREVAHVLEKKHFVFLFAPLYHPSFKHIMPIRKELGIRTIFNFLGPLVNPTRPRYRLIGVPTLEVLPLIAGALAHIGGSTSAVVYGAGGYDELTPIGPAHVVLVRGNTMEPLVIDPAQYGFAPCTPEDLVISGPKEGEAVLRQLLAGKGAQAMRDMVALNVGLSLFLLTSTPLVECMEKAKRAVAEGVGGEVLHA